jgi:DNA-binding beta-propeller fold protein YncE
MIHNKSKLVLRLATLIGLLALSLSPSFGTAATQGPKMYWTEGGMGPRLSLANDDGNDRIRRANADGTGLEGLVTQLNGPMGIALDIAAGKMYWAEGGALDNFRVANDDGTGSIKRANLDGTEVEELVTGLDGPVGIALDTGKMYWTEGGAMTTDTKAANDDGDGKIKRANRDGTEVEELVIGLDGPQGMALDGAGMMYWVELGAQNDLQAAAFDYNGRIKRANLDGGGVEVLAEGLVWPRDIALDIAGGKMYTTHEGGLALRSTDSTGYIQVTNLDGTGGQVLVSGLSRPGGIALDIARGKMYWTDRMSQLGGGTGQSQIQVRIQGQIRRANLDGTGVEVLLTELAEPRGIALHFAKTLTVSVAGSGGGSGMVTSDPAGINCGAACTASYLQNTVVTLTAYPGPKSYLASWSGACVSTGALTAEVTMDDDKTCTATFGYPVGGIVVPVDKVGLLAPWMGLVALAAVVGVLLLRAQRRR